MARLIVPTDFSPAAEKALDQAFLLAKKNNDEVELLHVVLMPPIESPKAVRSVLGEKKTEVERLKDLAQSRIKGLKLPDNTRWRVKVVYAEAILEGIMERFGKAKAKLVVMGTTGTTGFANRIFGSNTGNLIAQSSFPVLAIPPDWKPVNLQKLEFCMTPDQLSNHTRDIKKWSSWLGAGASVLYLTKVPNLMMKRGKSAFPVKTVITDPEDPLYEDLVEYSKSTKNTALVMFVHERPTVFDRIFNRSVTRQVANHLQIPLLALPVKGE